MLASLLALALFWDHPRIQACCSHADAVYGDVSRIDRITGKFYVTITGGGPRNHSWAPIGREFEVPMDRVVPDPTEPEGHALVFLRQFDFEVLCYVPGAGT
jgi:hypothetical protein